MSPYDINNGTNAFYKITRVISNFEEDIKSSDKFIPNITFYPFKNPLFRPIKIKFLETFIWKNNRRFPQKII